MKITFEFNEESHAFKLIPEDDLETQVLTKMADGHAKGKSVTLSKIHGPIGGPEIPINEFRVEIKVNGK